MRVGRIKALLSSRRRNWRGSSRDAQLARAVMDSLERRVLFANIIQVQVALDEDNMGNAFANSLRAAITEANATPGSTIEFTDLASEPIQLNADLSAVPITGAGTTIDGTQSPGGQVTINGTGGFNGLDVQAANITIKGLSFENLGLNKMAPGAAITLDTGSTGAVIEDDEFTGNYDAVDITNTSTDDTIEGSSLLSSSNDGIHVTNGSSGDTIGGTDAAERNIISGNGAVGVNIDDPNAMGTSGVVVEGNYIGTDTTGEMANPNGIGVELQDVNGITIQHNLISGNTTQGVMTTDPSGLDTEFGNSILNNTIGLDATGAVALANAKNGVLLEGGTLTGGPGGTPEGDTVMGNTIEDNGGNGVNIQETLVATTPMVVYSGGMYSQIVQNTIISNGDNGIVVNKGSEANTISQNSISLNGLVSGNDLGIDLSNKNGTQNVNSFNEDGITLDSPTSGTGVGTSATGGNGLTPFPVLGTIIVDPNNSNMYQVPIELEGNPGAMGTGTMYTIELFSNAPTALGAVLNGQHYGEGATYLGSVPIITTTANQYVTGTFDIPKSLAGDYISATATDISPFSAEFNPAAGGTSEFSADSQVPGAAIPSITIGNATSNVGNNINFPITLSIPTNQQITVNYTFTAGTAPLADFDSTAGTFTIPPNTTLTTLPVAAINDSTKAAENFTITLSGPVNATLANEQSTESAIGTITPNAGTTASMVTLTGTPTPVKSGVTVTLTATVGPLTGGGSGTVEPTGSINFTMNGVSLGTSPINGAGQAIFTTTTLPVGIDPIVAVYAGDTMYGPSTSAPFDVDVRNHIITTITLTAAPTSLALGGNVLLSATISDVGGGTPPSGTHEVVDFYDDGTLIGTSSDGVNGAGQAFFATTNLNAGTNTLTAVYVGDNLYDGSTSAPVSVSVALPPFLASDTFLSASVDTVAAGGAVTFTADVEPDTFSAQTPTGSVSFFDNGVVIGAGTVQSDGSATLTTTTLPAGTDDITADYSGDTTFGPSVSNTVPVTVTSNTTITLTASNDLVYVGESVTLSATLNFTLTNGAAPTGTVTFIENGNALANPMTLPADGLVTLNFTPTTVDVNTITAVYSGDVNYGSSTSAPVTQTVIASPNSVISLRASAKLLHAVGDPVTLTATVSATTAGGATPTGSVTFVDGSTVLGSVDLSAGGVASLTTTALVQGINTITATYGGSSTYTASLPAQVSVNVDGPGLLPINTVTVLTSAIAGTKIHALTTVTLMNPTASTTTGVGTLNLYASTDGTVDTTSTLIKTLVLNELNVKSQKSVNVKDIITELPASLASGGYTLLGLMMSPSGIVDFSSTGPTFSVVAPFISLSESVSTVNLGQSIVSGAATKGSVKLVVTNHGNIPSSGLTTFNITASPASGVVGTTIISVTKKVTIPAGKSKTIVIPLTSIPVLANGQYYLVTQVTDPNSGVSVASSGAVTIAAPFVALSAAFAPGSSAVLTLGATIIITNNGNIDDVAEFSALVGFSTDSAGVEAVPQVSQTIFTPVLHLKAGKSVAIHLNGWKSLKLGLTAGVQYYATVKLTDETSNSAFAVDSAFPVSV